MLLCGTGITDKILLDRKTFDKRKTIMNEYLETAWIKTVNCAISNSIDYHLASPTVSYCSTELLEHSIVRFIIKNLNCDKEQASAIYRDCITKAQTKKRADGTCPRWAICGLCLGLILGAVEIISCIVLGFTWVFLLFLFISISLCKSSLNCVSAHRSIRLAAKAWKKALNENTAHSMEDMLDIMQHIITNNGNIKIKLEF